MSDASVFTIFDVPITLTLKSDLLAQVEQNILAGKPLFITTPNPEILVFAQNDPSYRKIVQASDIALPDGTGVVMYARMHGQILERIPGREFFVDLLDLANKNHWNVYLLGSTERVMSTSLARIQQEYPQIAVKGSAKIIIDEAGKSLSEFDEQQIVHDVKTFAPHLLFVALGHPKQERWIYRTRELFPQTTMMAIGGTLDTFSGVIPPAPVWMSRLGLEWVFRLMNDPRRLKRIINAVLVFPWMAIRRT